MYDLCIHCLCQFFRFAANQEQAMINDEFKFSFIQLFLQWNYIWNRFSLQFTFKPNL